MEGEEKKRRTVTPSVLTSRLHRPNGASVFSYVRGHPRFLERVEIVLSTKPTYASRRRDDLTCKNTIRPVRSLAIVAVWRRKAGRSNWDCNWDCNIAAGDTKSLACRAARTPSSSDQAAISAKMIDWCNISWKLISRVVSPRRIEIIRQSRNLPTLD